MFLNHVFCNATAAFTDLHLVLQNLHVSLLHQFVERYKFSEALSHSHDLSLSGQVERQLQSCVQPHLPDTATQDRLQINTTLQCRFINNNKQPVH